MTAMTAMAAGEQLMRVALDEASRGRGRTSPNPMVGCVIAKKGRVIAKGYHQRVGGAHAEISALRRAGRKARGADVYVNLEPCDHQGRTAPCTEALIKAEVARVFVATRDPNPRVFGRGIKRLRRAGIEVEIGLLGAESRRLNEAFELAMRERRPYVVAKLAQSLDGRVATRTGDSQWITGERARAFGHRLRGTYDAIAVGIGTVRADDPRLDCRTRGGRDPVRVILDTGARTPLRANVVRAAKRTGVPTLIAIAKDAPRRLCHALEKAGAELLPCRLRRGRIDIDDLLQKLYARDIHSLLVEGGPAVLGSFFDAGRVDKVHAFVAPLVIGGDAARSSVGARGIGRLREGMRLADVSHEMLGDDLHICGYPRPVF